MLGFYENFPRNIHKITHLATPFSNKRLQKTLIQTLQEINTRTFNLEDIADPSISQCMVILEFGIAEANNFNYLDQEEAHIILKAIQKKPLQLMDFYCSIRYYKTQNEKKIPLKFDYYMIRFIFNKNALETQVFHERGPRHISSEDIVDFIGDKINEKFSKKILKALENP